RRRAPPGRARRRTRGSASRLRAPSAASTRSRTLRPGARAEDPAPGATSARRSRRRARTIRAATARSACASGEPGADVGFDPLDDLLCGGARLEQLGDAELLERGHILVGNDAAAE